MASAPQRMASTDALQIKDSGTSGRYFTRNHNVGNWLSTQISTSTVTFVTQSVSVSTTTYIKRGFFPSSGQYEYWSTTNRDAAAPSGHTLIDITVTGEIRS